MTISMRRGIHSDRNGHISQKSKFSYFLRCAMATATYDFGYYCCSEVVLGHRIKGKEQGSHMHTACCLVALFWSASWNCYMANLSTPFLSDMHAEISSCFHWEAMYHLARSALIWYFHFSFSFKHDFKGLLLLDLLLDMALMKLFKKLLIILLILLPTFISSLSLKSGVDRLVSGASHVGVETGGKSRGTFGVGRRNFSNSSCMVE